MTCHFFRYLLCLALLMPLWTFANPDESDLDFEVEKREFTTDELQDYEIEDHSDLPYVQAQDYNIALTPEEKQSFAAKTLRSPEKQKKGLLKSIFKKSFKDDPENPQATPLKPGISESEQSSKNETTIPSNKVNLGGYFPNNPLNESYQGSKLTVDVYKSPGAGLPEIAVAKIDGNLVYAALASTARAGKSTPSGSFYSIHYKNMRHRSSLYNQSPMPYAQFFNGNIAFHGVLEEYYAYLGGKASAGCVRLQVDDGLRFWRMANAVGMNVITTVHASGSEPPVWELEAIRLRVKENFKQRDYYVTNFQKRGYRSPYWPTGYFDGHGIDL